MRFHNDPDGTRLPIKLDSASNGEYVPIPLAPVHREANALALQGATEHAKRLGIDRRSFLVSASGAASTLLAMNTAYARTGLTGGFFDVPREAALDIVAARSAVDGNEFIFDVQGHFVNPRAHGSSACRLARGRCRGSPIRRAANRIAVPAISIT
jgi:uncharacterized protein